MVHDVTKLKPHQSIHELAWGIPSKIVFMLPGYITPGTYIFGHMPRSIDSCHLNILRSCYCNVFRHSSWFFCHGRSWLYIWAPGCDWRLQIFMQINQDDSRCFYAYQQPNNHYHPMEDLQRGKKQILQFTLKRINITYIESLLPFNYPAGIAKASFLCTQ